MDYQRSRMLLLLALVAVGFALYGNWIEEHEPNSATALSTPKVNIVKSDDVPSYEPTEITYETESVAVLNVDQLIQVETDVLQVYISPEGGDIVKADLLTYPKSLNTPKEGFALLDQTNERNYVAQTGVLGKIAPDSRAHGRAVYKSAKAKYKLIDGQNSLRVELLWQHPNGVQFTKFYEFSRASHLIKTGYDIDNKSNEHWQGKFYGQIRRSAPEGSSGMLGRLSYTGSALYTPDKPYKKISFDDMADKNFDSQITGGWAAMVEHYFLSAYIPAEGKSHEYFTRVDSGKYFNIGAKSDVNVKPHEKTTIAGELYLGPEITDTLKGISDGLNLTIDYGFLWPISSLLFLIMKNIYKFVGNWGWSIILVTLVIKLAFYKLSATSYRSMGKMRKLQPQMQALKERCGEDKQKFSQEMMGLYKKEKVNPLGGCLPILIQIPVFIALYYVLLESVELRQAPFIFWIKDLSAKDPYFVLPLLMGASMFVQQKLSPAPPDPIQAKVFMLMPIVFTVLFLSFPSGLVLYWVINNVLSISQQWYITRKMDVTTQPARNAKAANS